MMSFHVEQNHTQCLAKRNEEENLSFYPNLHHLYILSDKSNVSRPNKSN